MASKRRKQVPRPEPGTAATYRPDVDRLATIEASRVYVCEQHGLLPGNNAQFVEVYKYTFDGIKTSFSGRYLVFGNQKEFFAALLDMNNYESGEFCLIYPDPKRGDESDTAIGVYAFVPLTRPTRN